MLPVQVKTVSITDIGFVLFLKHESDERVLPIFIGPVEAQAISMTLAEQKPKRPLTHDLFVATLEATRQKVLKVEIVDIKNETFYSVLWLQHERYAGKSETGLHQIDARPSDAITLALKTKAPLFVADHLMKNHGVLLPETGDEKREITPVGDDSHVSRRLNEQLGIYQKMLDDAVSGDRFEEAARIRDKIDALMGRKDN